METTRNVQSGAIAPTETAPSTEAPPPQKSSLDLYNEMKAEKQAFLTRKRQDFIQALTDFKAVGGQDDVAAGVLDLVNQYPEGLPLPYAHTVFVEAELTAAIKSLSAAGKIKKEGKKGKYVLIPVLAA